MRTLVLGRRATADTDQGGWMMKLRRTEPNQQLTNHAGAALRRAQELADASRDNGHAPAWLYEAHHVGDLSALASAFLSQDPR
jgi:hypothetical protein